MKIIENRSMGINFPAAQLKGSVSSAASSAQQSVSPASFPDRAVLQAGPLSMRASQTALAGSERALGVISRLGDTIRNAPVSAVMTPLQNSVLQAAASLQRSYPHYAQRLRNFMSNIDMLSSEIIVIKRELGDSVRNQRQGIAKTLIAQQNQDAAAQRSYSPKDAAAIARGLSGKEAEALFARRPNAVDLLQ